MRAELHIAYGHSLALQPLCDRRSYTHNVKPGLDRAFLKGLVLCFPVAAALWVGIIYSASRLAR